MLQKILGSELKIKLIDFFISQEEAKSFSYLDISRALNLKGSIWRREVKELLDLNFFLEIKKEEVLNLKKVEKKTTEKKKTSQVKESFSLNPDFFLLPELKALLAKSKVYLSYEIFKDIETLCRPKLLILTGKFIGKKDSLADLIIVGQINRRNFLRLISELEKTMKEEINYSIMTEEEFKYRRYVMDIFLYEVINNEPIVLIGSIDDFDLLNKTSGEK